MSETQEANHQAEDATTIPFFAIGNFPYVTPHGYGNPVFFLSSERAEQFRQKALGLSAQYRAYKGGGKVPGFEVVQAEIDAVAAATEALVKAQEEKYAADEALYAKFSELGLSAHDYREASKREGQRRVCAAMMEDFPELAEHPKYKAVAAGTPTQVDYSSLEGSSGAGDDDGADHDASVDAQEEDESGSDKEDKD